MSWKDVVAGTCGGIAVTLVGHPFDTVKVRLQTQPSDKPIYNGVVDCVKKTIKVRGASPTKHIAGCYTLTLAYAGQMRQCLSLEWPVSVVVPARAFLVRICVSLVAGSLYPVHDVMLLCRSLLPPPHKSLSLMLSLTENYSRKSLSPTVGGCRGPLQGRDVSSHGPDVLQVDAVRLVRRLQSVSPGTVLLPPSIWAVYVS